MANKNRNEINQPPTGEGKKQSKYAGEANKLSKRAEVLQSSYAEQNIGSTEEEEAALATASGAGTKQKKARAGR